MSNKITKGELHADIVQTLNNAKANESDYVRNPGVATTTNVGNAYSVTLTPAPSGYLNGLGIVATFNSDSTGNATLNVNGYGALPIKKADGSYATNLRKDGVYSFRLSSGAFILQGESEVNIGQQIITPSITSQAILKGVHDGTGYVEGSPNLIASNIKKGVNMFGVMGSLEELPDWGNYITTDIVKFERDPDDGSYESINYNNKIFEYLLPCSSVVFYGNRNAHNSGLFTYATFGYINTPTGTTSATIYLRSRASGQTFDISHASVTNSASIIESKSNYAHVLANKDGTKFMHSMADTMNISNFDLSQGFEVYAKFYSSTSSYTPRPKLSIDGVFRVFN